MTLDRCSPNNLSNNCGEQRPNIKSKYWHTSLRNSLYRLSLFKACYARAAEIMSPRFIFNKSCTAATFLRPSFIHKITTVAKSAVGTMNREPASIAFLPPIKIYKALQNVSTLFSTKNDYILHLIFPSSLTLCQRPNATLSQHRHFVEEVKDKLLLYRSSRILSLQPVSFVELPRGTSGAYPRLPIIEHGTQMQRTYLTVTLNSGLQSSKKAQAARSLEGRIF